MNRRLVVAVAAGLAMAAVGCTAPQASAARPPAASVTLGEGIVAVDSRATQCQGGGDEPAAHLLRSGAALATRLSGLGIDAANREAILDWPTAWEQGEALLIVQAGMQPNPGHRLVVDRLAPSGSVLQVTAHIDPPARGSLQPQVIVHPCVALRLNGLPAAVDRVDLALPPAR